MATRPPAVLVTGASTGIGRACAEALARRGWSVHAGVRNEAAAASIRDAGIEGLSPLTIDVAQPASVEAAFGTIRERVGERGLAGLVNNAGVVVAGPVETTSVEDYRRQFEVNVWGLLRVSQAALGLIRTARGRIVNIGSMGGRIGQPFMAPYCASKHAVEAISDAMRLELAASGIEVSLVQPGAIATEIWDKGLSTLDEIRAAIPEALQSTYGPSVDKMERVVRHSQGRGIPPAKVADVVVHALTARRPRTRYAVGTDAKVVMFMRRWLPERVFDGIIRRQVGI